ncbi:Uncharacterized protein YlbG, UPF0298 family [Gracilibacillus ureilyticus]|uniref:UPF0298 protein SAMN04487944_11412 n=1 Tax=Gracilibacillus ureilyticus TaxID=531814 RepID=A0A1H9TI96_9BACI|nr:DUF2129 domain-containing protein [Gracilibacillus ureilyticus]SER96881.1 Uncharacterized protein YlbG, UPF0298 family [Gracilibacillus ureilyticus]
MLTKRQAIIVWFHHMKNVKQLKRYGHLVHVSKKLKYAMIYVNQHDYEESLKMFKRLPYITRVEPSYKPFIKTDYENAATDKAKEYDYKMGI